MSMFEFFGLCIVIIAIFQALAALYDYTVMKMTGNWVIYHQDGSVEKGPGYES